MFRCSPVCTHDYAAPLQHGPWAWMLWSKVAQVRHSSGKCAARSVQPSHASWSTLVPLDPTTRKRSQGTEDKVCVIHVSGSAALRQVRSKSVAVVADAKATPDGATGRKSCTLMRGGVTSVLDSSGSKQNCMAIVKRNAVAVVAVLPAEALPESSKTFSLSGISTEAAGSIVSVSCTMTAILNSAAGASLFAAWIGRPCTKICRRSNPVKPSACT